MPQDDNILNPELWVERHADYLYNYAMSRTNNPETAVDLVQETYVSAFKGKDNFQGKSSERTWLVSILKRKVVDFYRKSYRNKETGLIEETLSDSSYADPFEDSGLWKIERSPSNWEKSGETSIESEEFNKMLQDCIDALNEKQAAVFTLQVIEEMESDEICKELDISSSNLWVLIHRARLKIRECVEHNWLNI